MYRVIRVIIVIRVVRVVSMKVLLFIPLFQSFPPILFTSLCIRRVIIGLSQGYKRVIRALSEGYEMVIQGLSESYTQEGYQKNNNNNHD